jgi:hypothetical protein
VILFAVADEAPQLFLALRRRSARLADFSQTRRFSVKSPSSTLAAQAMPLVFFLRSLVGK